MYHTYHTEMIHMSLTYVSFDMLVSYVTYISYRNDTYVINICILSIHTCYTHIIQYIHVTHIYIPYMYTEWSCTLYIYVYGIDIYVYRYMYMELS